MNNSTLVDLAARAVDIARHPMAGQVLYFHASPDNRQVYVQLFGNGERQSLGAQLAWAYLVNDVAVKLRRNGNGVHATIRGSVLSGRIDITCVYDGDVAAELASHVEWKGLEATTSLHHLRAVQVGAYRTAAAA